MPRFRRGIQYAVTSRVSRNRLWNTGSPGQAGRRRQSKLFETQRSAYAALGSDRNNEAVMASQNSSDWLGLSGRACVVTGGGGGIGRAVAVNLARAGAKVAAIDRDERGLEATHAALREI